MPLPRAPTLLVTPLVAPDRVASLEALHARTPIELALFGGRSHHATSAVEELAVPHRHVRQRDVLALAARGGHRAVIAGTAGRLALPAAYAGARLGRRPFVLWDALWHQPRSAGHAAGAQLMRVVLRNADAIAAYGTHVERFARARGAQRVVLTPQAVDPAFWEAPADAARPQGGPCAFAFVGRDAPGKGLDLLLRAWEASGLADDGHTLLLAGPTERAGLPRGVRALGPLDPDAVRNLLDAVDVLVVPSTPTPTFLEPWGLVCNEAMHRALPLIATTAVGAAAGGLVRDGATGVVVPHDDAPALTSALVRLAGDRAGRRRLGEAGHAAVQAFVPEAWADGMAAAIELAERHHDTRTRQP